MHKTFKVWCLMIVDFVKSNIMHERSWTVCICMFKLKKNVLWFKRSVSFIYYVFVVFRQYNNPFKSTNYLYSDGLEIQKNITSLPDFPNLIQKCKGRFSGMWLYNQPLNLLPPPKKNKIIRGVGVNIWWFFYLDIAM